MPLAHMDRDSGRGTPRAVAALATLRLSSGSADPDGDVSLCVVVTKSEYRRVRAVAEKHGWSDTQVLREAIRLLTATEAAQRGAPQSPTKPERTSARDAGQAPRPPQGADQPVATDEGVATRPPAQHQEATAPDADRTSRRPAKHEAASATTRGASTRPAAKPARTPSPRKDKTPEPPPEDKQAPRPDGPAPKPKPKSGPKPAPRPAPKTQARSQTRAEARSQTRPTTVEFYLAGRRHPPATRAALRPRRRLLLRLGFLAAVEALSLRVE